MASSGTEAGRECTERHGLEQIWPVSPIQGDGRIRPAYRVIDVGRSRVGGHMTSQDIPEGCRWAAEGTASWRCCVSAPAMNRPGSLRLDTGAGRERPQ